MMTAVHIMKDGNRLIVMWAIWFDVFMCKIANKRHNNHKNMLYYEMIIIIIIMRFEWYNEMSFHICNVISAIP